MAGMTITEAFAEITVIDRHLKLKRGLLTELVTRPANRRDPLASVGSTATVVAEEYQAIMKLEEHRLTIRRAIRSVASKETITLGGQTRTITDWLEYRKKVAGNKYLFLNTIRNEIASARDNVGEWNCVNAEGVASYLYVDIVVNVPELEMMRQLEEVEEVASSLDGQLSLKSATLTIDIETIAPSLLEREAVMVGWLKQMGLLNPLEAKPPVAQNTSYTVPDEYDAYSGYGMTTVPMGLQSTVRNLLEVGQKLEAIRLVREQTGWTVSRSKEAVEALL